MRGRHLGLLLAHVEGDGVDEGLGVHLVVVHGALVPDLVGRPVVYVGEVAGRAEGHLLESSSATESVHIHRVATGNAGFYTGKTLIMDAVR